MKEICKYKLLCATSPDALNALMREHLPFGWQPYGNPCASENCFAQAVVVYKEKE